MSLMRTQGTVGVRVGAVVGRARARRRGKQLGTLGIAAIALALLAPVTAEAQVETSVSANAGWVSQYYYRGIFQEKSSASAGLDLSAGPVSVGTWLADVGDGAEVDLFGSVGFGGDNFSGSVGFTAYLYTGEFDDTYLEGNINIGSGPVSYEFSFGQYENFTGPTLDYWFTGVTIEQEGLYGTVAGFGGDFSGNYGELGYGFSAAELDFSIVGILSDAELSGLFDSAGLPTPGLTLVFGIGKTFEF